MATFGNTSIGGTPSNDWANYKAADKFVLSEAGLVSKLSVRLSNGANACNVKAVIYADSGGAPGSLVATGSATAITSGQAEAWVDLMFASPVSLAAGTYWLAVIGDATANTLSLMRAESGGSFCYAADTYADGPSDPFGAPAGSSYLLSIYATYTVPLSGMSQSGTVPGPALELHAARAHLGVSQGHNGSAETQWYDTSGNGNHGTLTTFGFTTASGWAGNGTLADPYRLVFDGTSDIITLPSIGAANDSSYTYEAWVNVRDISAGNNVIISEMVNQWDPPLVALYVNSDGVLCGTVWAAGWGGAVSVVTGEVVDDEEWHHVVMTCDSAAVGLTVYADGVAHGPSGAVSASASLTLSQIGGYANTASFPGALAVARIYPFALSPTQVEQNFTAGMLWASDPFGASGFAGMQHSGPYIKIGSFDIPVLP